MHSLVGQTMLYDRGARVMLGNSLELEVTRERALIRVGGIEADAPKEEIVYKDAGIVYAFLMVAQVIEEQGRDPEDEGEIAPRSKPAHCVLCDGRGGGFDHQENWLDCPECSG